jgi:cytoskeletal protein CcmA (bactofilin family)
MFSKQTKAPVRPMGKTDSQTALVPTDPGRKTAPKVASLVSSDITVEGDVIGDGELHLDGTVRGDVRVARLTIGETGQVEGAIHAEAVEVRGRVIGTVTAKQVRLYGTAHIDGDITHEQLSIETGAFFQGRSLKFQRPPQPKTEPKPEPAAQAEIVTLEAKVAG